MGSPFQDRLSKDIALGVMVTVGAFAASALVPFLSFIFSAFMPLPIFFYRIKLGRHNGAWVPLAAMVVIGLTAGGLTVETAFFSGLMALGFVMGEMVEKSMPAEITIAVACGTVLAFGVIGLMMTGMATGAGMVELVSGYVKAHLDLSVALYQDIGMPKETIDAITGSLDQIQYALVRLLPSMITAFLLFVAWINLIVGRSLMIRQGLSIPDYGRLNHWRAPDGLVWGVIASGIILVLIPSTGWRWAGINGLLVMMAIYFIQGIAIVSFFFDKKKLPRAVRVLFYSMIAFQQIFAMAVVCLGFFDMWVDFRKISSRRREPDLPD